jgi:hypothetical protein
MVFILSSQYGLAFKKIAIRRESAQTKALEPANACDRVAGLKSSETHTRGVRNVENSQPLRALITKQRVSYAERCMLLTVATV